MDQEQLRKAVYGAKDIGAPTGGDPVVNQAMAHRFSAPVVNAASNALANQSAMNLQAQKDAAAAAEKQKAALSDPKNYQKIPKADGGFAFFDPSGKEISAHDYALVTGQPVSKVLADSENPIDMAFTNDYNNLQKYMQAWQNGDKKTIDSIQKQSPALAKITNPQDLIKRFYQAYPTVYGLGGFNGPGTAGQPNGTSFIPNASAGQSNDNYSGDIGSIDSGGGIGG